MELEPRSAALFGASRLSYHGSGQLWVGLYPEGVLAPPARIESDGSISQKFPWWRGVRGQLMIRGKRLDGGGPPLTATRPGGYGGSGFQATGITFPSEGCWKVTGEVIKPETGEIAATLLFVTEVRLDTRH